MSRRLGLPASALFTKWPKRQHLFLERIHSQQLIQVVLSSIKNRFGKCFEVRDYRIAAFVHPMFKLNWLSNEDREKAIDQLKVEIEMEENRSGSAAGIESKDDGMLIYY